MERAYILMETPSPIATTGLFTLSVIVKLFAQHQIPVLATCTESTPAVFFRHLNRSPCAKMVLLFQAEKVVH